MVGRHVQHRRPGRQGNSQSAANRDTVTVCSQSIRLHFWTSLMAPNARTESNETCPPHDTSSTTGCNEKPTSEGKSGLSPCPPDADPAFQIEMSHRAVPDAGQKLFEKLPMSR